MQDHNGIRLDASCIRNAECLLFINNEVKDFNISMINFYFLLVFTTQFEKCCYAWAAVILRLIRGLGKLLAGILYVLIFFNYASMVC